VPTTLETTFDIRPYTFALVPMNAQPTSDANDFFSLSLQY
jgi:hypothetical protein